jgi:adenosylcobinamide kinase/adenosylcobinamide-phosphate guanylyltransferase
MAKIILIVGGSRSGKSEYARRRAEALAGSRLLLATCPPLDEEMCARIAAHRLARAESGWDTVEEFGNIVPALRQYTDTYNVILVDCLTLWLSNLMQDSAAQGRPITEDDAPDLCSELVDACAESRGHVFLVANEVGMGIVPENSLARQFRDLAGRCNQLLAASADEAVLVCCGIPLFLKRSKNATA